MRGPAVRPRRQPAAAPSRAEPRRADPLGAYLHRASLLLAGGRPGAAAGAAAPGDSDPDPAHLHYLRGEVAASVGDLAGAERQYDRAVAADPRLAAAWAARAVLRYRRGDQHGALADLDAAIRLAPEPVRSAAATPGQAGHPGRVDRRRG